MLLEGEAQPDGHSDVLTAARPPRGDHPDLPYWAGTERRIPELANEGVT